MTSKTLTQTTLIFIRIPGSIDNQCSLPENPSSKFHTKWYKTSGKKTTKFLIKNNSNLSVLVRFQLSYNLKDHITTSFEVLIEPNCSRVLYSSIISKYTRLVYKYQNSYDNNT